MFICSASSCLVLQRLTGNLRPLRFLEGGSSWCRLLFGVESILQSEWAFVLNRYGTINLYGKDHHGNPLLITFRHVLSVHENKGFDVQSGTAIPKRSISVRYSSVGKHTLSGLFGAPALSCRVVNWQKQDDGPLAWLLFPTLLSDYD